MSASYSEIKDKLIEDFISNLIKSGRRDDLIFESTANPPVQIEQWFIRKSSMPGYVTLGVQNNGKAGWIRRTDIQLDEILNGNFKCLEEFNLRLELSQLLLPEKVQELLRSYASEKSFVTSASYSVINNPYTAKRIFELIGLGHINCLIFESSVDFSIGGEQWFIRKSSKPDHVTLKVQIKGEHRWIRITLDELYQVLNGNSSWLGVDGGTLKLSHLVLPERAQQLICSSDELKSVAATHPRDKTYTLTPEELSKIIDSQYLSFLLFEYAARPVIAPAQWFLRKSTEPNNVTLVWQTLEESKTLELTTTQVDELLSGALVSEVGCLLKLSNIVVPESAAQCLRQLQKPSPRFFTFLKPGETVASIDSIHPVLRDFVR
ncbi:hypothetical protein [Legionella worsleiensis]|uniref:Uncharacterized protein n=1 Tax=Legionella worsleiensis TaxID=45076 RepID=A0A0W1A721_9GAMM|nr:hypothetical protein [Legionella worsleiensis]KTD76835.1 hypothetical protein Lwor_2060 [Legionella worsleiensis]STY30712.1 Uncharacterised protein [Legionella worsleiensis]